LKGKNLLSVLALPILYPIALSLSIKKEILKITRTKKITKKIRAPLHKETLIDLKKR
jgi:hypothetical protein